MRPSGPNSAEKSLGEIVAEVSEKASLLVREEIELAKAEMIAKARTLGKGAAVAGAAGVFLVFAVVMFLQTFAWFLTDVLNQSPWVGFGIVTILLVLAGLLAGLQAKKWLSTGPPTPDAAIEEAKITRETLERQGTPRDQVERSLEHDREGTRF
jgi:hypothetical protein